MVEVSSEEKESALFEGKNKKTKVMLKRMRITYDKEAGAAYVYIKYPIQRGEASKTVEVKENIILDFDRKGKLLGVEILNARKLLPSIVLRKAEPL